LFIADDVFIYLGNLEPVFAEIQRLGMRDACFAFSIECCGKEDFILRTTGRFAQSLNYIQLLSDKYNFSIELSKSDGIRKDKGNWIAGKIFILKKL